MVKRRNQAWRIEDAERIDWPRVALVIAQAIVIVLGGSLFLILLFASGA